MLLIYADGDDQRRRNQNDRFSEAMSAAGNNVRVVEVPDRTQGNLMSAMNADDDQIHGLVMRFLATAQGDWTTLFDGSSLDGWRVLGNANWELADGTVSANSGNGFLVSEESLRRLRVEARVLGRRARQTAAYSSAAPIPRASTIETRMRSISTTPAPIKRTEPEGSCTWRHRAP